MWIERRSGHIYQRGADDHRAPYERDATRVIHCPAFRRLQRKTQILGTDEGDFHRTRLTHSLEVASIGVSLSRNLRERLSDGVLLSLLPHDDLIRVICLVHDIGHPPFGHGGETALNYSMRDDGGFEGNAQTLRLLTKLEKSYGEYGLDLTRRSLLGILKYPVAYSALVAATRPVVENTKNAFLRMNDWLPPKGYFDCEQAEIDWILSVFSAEDRQLFQSIVPKTKANQHGKAQFYNLDCSIMNIADDIAYGVHDLEDAIHLRLIGRDKLDTEALHALLNQTPLAGEANRLLNNLFAQNLSHRKEAIGSLVHYFVTAVQSTITHPDFENPLLKYNISLMPEAEALLAYLQASIYAHVIDSQEARTFEYGGQMVVSRLFDAFNSNPASLLDLKNRELYESSLNDGTAKRIICDYIANMTDEYAYRMHERLFGFNTRTIFERL